MSVGRSIAHAMARGWAAVVMACAPAPAPAGTLAEVEALWAEVAPAVAAAPTLDAEAALARRSELVFVDVRADRERAVSMIPGAVTAEAVRQDPAAYRGRTLVAYCTIGLRSGKWAIEQREAGLDVVNLRGSLLAWTFAGGPLERAGRPVRTVHTYARRWAVVAPGYEAVW